MHMVLPLPRTIPLRYFLRCNYEYCHDICKIVHLTSSRLGAVVLHRIAECRVYLIEFPCVDAGSLTDRTNISLPFRCLRQSIHWRLQPRQCFDEQQRAKRLLARVAVSTIIRII
jgi:hypothetical protein